MKIKIGIAMGRQKCKNYSHNIVLQLAQKVIQFSNLLLFIVIDCI